MLYSKLAIEQYTTPREENFKKFLVKHNFLKFSWFKWEGIRGISKLCNLIEKFLIQIVCVRMMRIKNLCVLFVAMIYWRMAKFGLYQQICYCAVIYCIYLIMYFLCISYGVCISNQNMFIPRLLIYRTRMYSTCTKTIQYAVKDLLHQRWIIQH